MSNSFEDVETSDMVINETMKDYGSFEDVKAGDIVIRFFYGMEMEMEVESVDDHLIHTKGGWTFDRKTGIEEDRELGMGVAFGISCSQLIKK